MAITTRQAVVEGSPSGGTAWQHPVTVSFAAVSVTTGGEYAPLFVVPSASAGALDETPTNMFSLKGATLTCSADGGNSTHLSTAITVFRGGVTPATDEVGGGPALGWDLADSGTPDTDALVPLAMPFLVGVTNSNTAVVDSTLVLQPGDLICLFGKTDTSTATIAAGIVTLDIV